MQKIIDLDKVVKIIDNPNSFCFVVSFDNDEPVKLINNDLNSIKESLNNHTKIFLRMGFFIYDSDESYFGIETYDIKNSDAKTITVEGKEKTILLVKSSILENLNDEYYDKYKYSFNGYGIYLDNNLNIEYGYVTSDETQQITFHDFKNAHEGDLVKETIYSSINHANIWKTDDEVLESGGYDKEVSLVELVDFKTDILCFVNDKCFDVKKEDDILNELNKERTQYWRPIYGILNMVLDNGGKLYFKLTDDEGIFVIRKNNDKDVSQVGKYSHDEGEILLDKESDEDIYINTHVFKPKFTSISDVNQALKGKKINVGETYYRASSIDIFSDCSVDVSEDGSIYIHTVYASEGAYAGEEIYEYEIDDDDFTSVGVHSGLGNCTLRLSPQYYTGNDAAGADDYGIMIDNNGEIKFCEYTGGMFGGCSEIRDLSEPLNAFAIEIMMNTLIFEDPLYEGVMYCPDCGEDYDNGEKVCTDCGTELVTLTEYDLLELRRDYS